MVLGTNLLIEIRKDNWVSVTREIEKGFIELEFWSDSWEYQKEILKISEKECISRLLLHLYDVATISKRELQFWYIFLPFSSWFLPPSLSFLDQQREPEAKPVATRSQALKKNSIL